MAKTQKAAPTKETRAQKAQRIYQRAITLHQAGDLNDAIKGYALAIRLAPKSSDIYNNLGVALRASGRPEAALACYRRSLAITPGSASVYTNMGNALHDLGENTRAVEAHRRAVVNAPKSAKTYYNAGRALADVGQSQDALDHFGRAIKLQSDYQAAQLQHGETLLRLGDWPQGFKELEVRLSLPNRDPRRKDIPTWDGEQLDGKTILINYEGDEGVLIQYLRFMRELKKMGARVLVECPPHFNQLLKASPDIDATPNLGADLKHVDVQIPLLSLPGRLGINVKNVPAQEGYLPIPNFAGQQLDIHPDIRLAVGLVWSGEWAGRSTNGPIRPSDVKLEDLAELFGIPNIQLVSLELGHGTKDVTRLGLQPLIDQVGSSMMDVADMAGIIEQLDLVICVDSVAAHVAGAMGKPVWMLTKPGANWCWLEDQDNSPWYASMNIFRKGADHSWADIASSLRLTLVNILKGTA